MTDKPGVIRPTDAEAIALARMILRTAHFAALAAIDPDTGAPLVSRVGLATELDGTPLILVSSLAAHTSAIVADPRCAILVGEPGKGDPLAHPRLSVTCEAEQLDRSSATGAAARRRYLAHNPKAELYAGLGDFNFFRLSVQSASLNGGFGRAYRLSSADLLVSAPDWLIDAEASAIIHMNEDHAEAIDLIARHYAGQKADGWRIAGIDAEGCDLANGDRACRVLFPTGLADPADLRAELVTMTRLARKSAR